jgi:hypothetical protein
MIKNHHLREREVSSQEDKTRARININTEGVTIEAKDSRETNKC